MNDARQQLDEANAAITVAAQLLGGCRDTFEQFMRESEHMDSFGCIINPTLFISPERRATEAILKPLYMAALDFVRAHDRAISSARSALEKVNSNG